jgi:hypothetical protein
MHTRTTCLALLMVALPSYALADAQDIAMARVRLTTDSSMTRGCARLVSVRDDSLKDLRRKIVKAGGDTALLSFGQDDLSRITADVFHCAGASATAPSAAPRPAAAEPPSRPAAAEPPPLWQPRSK